MHVRVAICLLVLAAPAVAETVVAARTIRAKEIVMAQDIRLDGNALPGALQDPAAAIGKEARVTLYAGRPISAGDLGPAAVIERNELVTLLFRSGGLSIRADGRALGRGSVGTRLRVMNLSSKTTITGTVRAPGQVSVP